MTVVWDVDDVLNDLTRSWLEEWWKPAHLDCRIGYDEISVNPPAAILGITRDEYLASLDAFRLSAAAPAMAPQPEVLAWFEQHGHRFRHVALTSTPLRAAPASSAWVLRHFGRWIRTYAIVPSPRSSDFLPPTYESSKAEYLAWFGRGDLLVDDNLDNIEAARAAGIESWLVPRPWNRGSGTLAGLLQRLAARGAGRRDS